MNYDWIRNKKLDFLYELMPFQMEGFPASCPRINFLENVLNAHLTDMPNISNMPFIEFAISR